MLQVFARFKIAAVLLAFCAFACPQVSGASLAVELACAADYYAYCNKYDPDSAEVRICMRRNGRKLSQRCIRALVAAGEVSQSEVERRSASGQ
jgi:hypothetical protein